MSHTYEGIRQGELKRWMRECYRSHRGVVMQMEPRTNYALEGIVFIITLLVFGLDLITPLGMATWALYVLPIGLTRWSNVQQLTVIIGAICSVLIVVGYVFSPGSASEIAIVNRGLGLLMVWVVMFFLQAERQSS